MISQHCRTAEVVRNSWKLSSATPLLKAELERLLRVASSQVLCVSKVETLEASTQKVSLLFKGVNRWWHHLSWKEEKNGNSCILLCLSPFNYAVCCWEVSLHCPSHSHLQTHQVFKYIRLNSPSSLSLFSYYRCSCHLIIFVPLCWACSTIPISFLH